MFYKFYQPSQSDEALPAVWNGGRSEFDPFTKQKVSVEKNNIALKLYEKQQKYQTLFCFKFTTDTVQVQMVF